MSTKTTPYNPFDYLETQAEINDFMTECFQDEDPQIFVNALGHLLKKHGVSDVAETTGFSRESLYKSFNGVTQPKWNTVRKIMTALNIQLHPLSVN
jgi:probable addiction module antidote protein